MIRARHHILIEPLLKVYATLVLRRKFQRVDLEGEVDLKDFPVLLVSNHSSWWDGFWIAHLNRKLFHRRIHFMMLEENLKKHWYFRYTGGYSVRRKSRSMLESLNYTAGLLGDHRNMVFLFPQGDIQSMHVKEIHFQKGLAKILSMVPGKVQLVFLVNLVDYFSRPKPSLVMYFKEYTDSDYSKDKLQNHYDKFFQECRNIQMRKTH
jgi:1-acyl-sn-glycerol-3-phosphate acyltransferase